MHAQGFPRCVRSDMGEVPAVDTELSGTLDGEACCDTYEIWRRPGRCGYALRVRGAGAVHLVIEAHDPGGAADAGGWREVAEAPTVAGGSRVTGTVVVPEVRFGGSVSAEWVRLRVRISRTAGTSVSYEFSLETEAAPPAGPPSPGG